MQSQSTIIERFCSERDASLWEYLSEDIQKIIIEICYKSMFYKFGDIQTARWILETVGDLERGGNINVYAGNHQNESLIHKMHHIGIVTIPVIPAGEIADVRREYRDTRIGFPEYRRQEGTELTPNGEDIIYVLGKFAALGNPASFHSPWVRELRLRTYRIVREQLLLPLMNSVFAGSLRNGYTEMLFDRLMWRYPGQAPEAESFHRDVIPGRFIGNNDEVFGGWLNLDETSQYFSAVPGSHLGISLKTLQPGFAKVPRDEIALVKPHVQRFECPPGHVIVFPQYIIHEVLAIPARNNMARLFTGWRISDNNVLLHQEKIERMRNQAIMPLPSNQDPPMFSSHHGSAWLARPFHPISPRNPIVYSTSEWSLETFKPTLIISGINGIERIPRFLDSLYALSRIDPTIMMYPAYSNSEERAYRPLQKNEEIPESD